MGYSFAPMMPFYVRFGKAPTKWLMSQEGRRLIAKAIRHCRNRYGKPEGRRFLDALYWVGCIYPIVRSF